MSENIIPSIIVIDNFYPNPDEIRAIALATTYDTDYLFYKGARSLPRFDFPGLKETFQKITNTEIKNWDMPVNTKFQYTTVLDPIIYHGDAQQWAGAVYLNPNAPPSAGTSFYTEKDNGISYEKDHIFYDRTRFIKTDTIANVYNRLVIWPGRSIHSASANFGDQVNNARLNQVFFWE